MLKLTWCFKKLHFFIVHERYSRPKESLVAPTKLFDLNETPHKDVYCY